MSKKRGYSVGEIIITVIFILWFIGTLVGLLYFSDKDNVAMVVLLFGNYLFVFGLSAIFLVGMKLKKIWILLFPIIGLTMMVMGSIFMRSSDKAKLKIENLTPVLLISVFIVVGIGLVLITIAEDNRLKKICTYRIMAKCIKLNTTISRSNISGYGTRIRRLYAPVFSYYFREKNYVVAHDKYTNYGYPEVDESVYIFINPDNPSEIYFPSKINKILLISGGIIFLIAGSISMYLYIS
ncbi:MAG: hypothetical protein WAP98_00575 [Caldicoprobacterales bacterium]|jgi:hypothetical protein|nr:hypothetical protein [Bacillota bacterium]NLK03358.1 hypothetical protein [Clostridiales bacterium]